MLLLTRKELKSQKDAKECYICGKGIEKKNRRVRDHCSYIEKYRSPGHSIWNLKFKIPYDNPIVLHNDSNCDYNFIIKGLANKFKGQLECLGENKEM